jgi:hypothetical protein
LSRRTEAEFLARIGVRVALGAVLYASARTRRHARVARDKVFPR